MRRASDGAVLAAILALAATACTASDPEGPRPHDAPRRAEPSEAAVWTGATPGAVPSQARGSSTHGDAEGESVAAVAPLVVVVGEARIEGRGAAPGMVVVAAAGGEARGRGGAVVIEGGGWWTSLEGADAEGGDLLVRPGDAVLLRRSDRVAGAPSDEGVVTETVRLPGIAIDFDVAAGGVDGLTAPGAAVAVDASSDAGRARAGAVADAAGRFALALDPPAALATNHPVTVTVTTPAVTLVVPRRVPYVRVSTHPGDLTGYGAPVSAVTATLLGAPGPDGGRDERGRAVLPTDGAGRFDGWLRAADGTRVRPRPGDALVLEDADGRREVAVAPLAIAPDLGRGVLAGGGAPGDAIQITLWNPWRPGAVEDLRGAVDGGGRWSLPTRHGLPPATHFYVTERDARGDETFHCYQVPKLHVEPGSPAIGVEALWDVEADLRIERGGATVGRASGGGTWATDVELVVRDDGGRPVALRPGDRVAGTLDGRDVALEVPALSAAIVGPVGGDGVRIAGTGPPGAVLGLAGSSPLGITTTVGADGRYALETALADLGWPDGPAPAAVAPGIVLRVVLELPGGHAARAPLPGAELEVTLYASGASGRAAPGASIRIESARGDGRSASRVGPAVAVDLTGAFTATLPQAVVPGDRLVLRVDGQPHVTVTVPAVTAALDAARGIVTGQAPPDSVLDARVWYGAEPRPEHLAVVTRGPTDESSEERGLLVAFALALPAPGARRVELAWEGPGMRVVREVDGSLEPWPDRDGGGP